MFQLTLLIASLLAIVLAIASTSEKEASPHPVRVCYSEVDPKEELKCNELKESTKDSDCLQVLCVRRKTSKECFHSLQNNEVDVINLEIDIAYSDIWYYQLSPNMWRPHRNTAVAIVRTNSSIQQCSDINTRNMCIANNRDKQYWHVGVVDRILFNIIRKDDCPNPRGLSYYLTPNFVFADNPLDCLDSGQGDIAFMSYNDAMDMFDTCFLPSESGFCLSYFPKWYYDSTERVCKQFIYGSCGANQNRFHSKEECERRCNNVEVIVKRDLKDYEFLCSRGGRDYLGSPRCRLGINVPEMMNSVSLTAQKRNEIENKFDTGIKYMYKQTMYFEAFCSIKKHRTDSVFQHHLCQKN